ncbi:putative importin beta-1 subunit [Histomonas meleagridis]|uniref:putative importin beta-1 subunit n=1 Tax=Histomonas meleagridis TaxID=135588 RepID=UPI00355A1C6B|nr:putative importin beta-1 subunit [Histomonas meleagridis]
MNEQNDAIELCNNFLALNNPDPNIRNPAQEIINQKMGSDPLRFILTCSSILNQDNFPPSSYFFSIFFINRRLTPNNLVKIEVIRDNWMNFSEEHRGIIKNAIFRGLLFPDKAISNEAAHTFAKIFSIERNEMIPLIDQLFILIQSPDYSNETHIAGINALYEICADDILGQMTNSDEVKSCLAKIFSFAGQIMLNRNNSEEMKISLCNVFNSLISIASPLFENENVFNGFVTLINNYLADNPTIEFHQHLIQLHISLTKKFYSSQTFNFNDIGEITVRMTYGEQNADKLLNVLEFWDQITKFELRKVQRIRFEQNYIKNYTEKGGLPYCKDSIHKIKCSPPIRNLTAQTFQRISQRLMQFLTFLPPDQSNPEVQLNGVHSKAFQVLSNMYELCSKPVFDMIQNFWLENYQNIENCPLPILHSLLLTVAIISSEPQCPQQREEILNFLTRSLSPDFEFYISKFLVDVMSHPSRLIVDTTLYVISLVLENYDLYMNPETIKILIDQMTNHLLDHPIITERIFNVITAIIHRCVNYNHMELYEEIYVPLKCIYDEVLNQSNISSSILQNLSYVIIDLIKYSPDSKMDVVGQALDNSLKEISQRSNFSDNPNYITILINDIYIITMCFRRFPDGFQEYGVPAANTLFVLMKSNNSVFEESLYGIINITSSLGSQAYKIFDEILPCIQHAISLPSPSLITTTLSALSELYKSILPDKNNPCYPQLISRLPSTFDLLIKSLHNFNFTRELNTVILRSLAKVVKYASNDIPLRDRDQLLQLYKKYLNTPLLIDSDIDRKYGEDLYLAVCEGLESLILTVQQNEVANKKLQKEFLFGITYKITQMQEQSPKCLMAICSLYETYYNKFGLDGNVYLLNPRCTHLVLCAMSLSIKDKKEEEVLHAKAEETWENLMKA